MKSTLIYIDNLERHSFYKRLMDALKDEKKFLILTNKLSVYLKTKGEHTTYLLKNIQHPHAKSAKNLQDTLSVAGEYHSLEAAQYISKCVNETLEYVYARHNFEMVFVFNATTTMGKTLGDFCKEKKIALKCIEISNLPNKLFADALGVNAKSSLYEHPEVLDTCAVSEKEFSDWKERYILQKTKPPQAKNKTAVRFLIVLDYFGFWFLNLLQEDFRNPLKVLKNKLFNKMEKTFPHADLDGEYIFFPLQVSKDSQLILNSDVDNVEALKKIKKRFPHAKVLVKIHPAEESQEFIKQVEEMQDEFVKIISNDTSALIKNAKLVVTINSTVGLEAMILGKDVEVLGRAIYSNFHHERLKSYICRYLINIDYFCGHVEVHEARRLYA
ncbi:hypothetical protein KKG72_08750 [bacterium]|nr:hypothetical protein [bacterium]MBU1995145.1 hypothetical protein [bacterium]